MSLNLPKTSLARGAYTVTVLTQPPLRRPRQQLRAAHLRRNRFASGPMP